IRALTVTGVQTCALPIFPFSILATARSAVAFFFTRKCHQVPADKCHQCNFHVRKLSKTVTRWPNILGDNSASVVYIAVSLRFAEIGRASCRERVYSCGVG